MKHLRLYLFCLLVVVIFNPVQAQISDSIQKWSIEECFKYAMAHNIEINTLLLNEQSSAQDLYEAKGSQIPNLSGSASQYSYCFADGNCRNIVDCRRRNWNHEYHVMYR